MPLNFLRLDLLFFAKEENGCWLVAVAGEPAVFFLHFNGLDGPRRNRDGHASFF